MVAEPASVRYSQLCNSIAHCMMQVRRATYPLYSYVELAGFSCELLLNKLTSHKSQGS